MSQAVCNITSPRYTTGKARAFLHVPEERQMLAETNRSTKERDWGGGKGVDQERLKGVTMGYGYVY